MAFDYCQVAGTYNYESGAPAVGTVSFKPRYPLKDGTTTITAPIVFSVTSGVIPGSAQVPITGRAGTSPVSAEYEVTEKFGGVVNTYNLQLSRGRTRIDLGVQTVSAGSVYLDAHPAATGVAAALYRGHTTCIQVSGDSTADATDEWFAELGRKLVTRYPQYNLMWRKWNDATQRYDAPQTLIAGPNGDSRVTFNTGQLIYRASSITGDTDIRVRARPTSWTSGTQTFSSKWTATTGGRGYLFRINPTGTLSWAWSADGAATVATVASTAPVPFANGTDGWVRVAFDVDNGAAGNTVTFYTSVDGTTWTQLGTPVITAGITSVFNSSAPYQAGGYSYPPLNPLSGDIYWTEVLNGINGPSVIPPLLNQWEQTSSPDTDTILYTGSPTLLLLCGSQSGQNIAYLGDPARVGKLFSPHGQQLVILSTGHNEGDKTAQDWFTAYSAWITNIKSLTPYTPILLLTQNPTKAPVTAGRIAIRAQRGSHILALAAATAGVYGVDTYPAFTDIATQINADGIHPVPAGSLLWAQYLDTKLFGG